MILEKKQKQRKRELQEKILIFDQKHLQILILSLKKNAKNNFYKIKCLQTLNLTLIL